MPSTRLSVNKRQAALILEARAGLIPESDWIAEEARARINRTAQLSRVVVSHAKRLTNGSVGLAVTEILTDLRHYCDAKGLVFEELDAVASENHLDEASQSHMADPC